VDEDSPVGRLDSVTIDCADPERQAAFWAAVFGTEEEWRGGDPVQYIDLAATPASPTIRFQRVPEPKTVKDRIHLDLRVDDLELAAARVVALGASPVEQDDIFEYDVAFRVMLDPEGNEFCLVAESG
jgi:predicted enzyme related to lactoylglutathione lyase